MAHAATLPLPRRSLSAELTELLPGVALALVMSWAVMHSLAISNWAPGLHVLVPATLPALLVGVVFARLRWLPAWLAHVLSAVLALTWVVQAIGELMSERLVGWLDRALELTIRTITLARVVSSGGRGEDILLFVAALAFLGWMLCYTTAWAIFRRGWLWRAVLLNALVILVNYTYVLPKPTTFVFVFLGSALLLLVYQNVLLAQEEWARKRMEYPDFMPLRFVWAAALVAILVALVTSVLPGGVTNDQAVRTWRFLSQPFREARERWEDIFSTIQAAPGQGGGSFASRSVQLGGSRVLNDELVMYVHSTRYDYWRAGAFDKYTGAGWENTTGEQARAALHTSTPEEARTPFEPDQPIALQDLRAREVVTQTMTLAAGRKDDRVFVGGAAAAVSLPILVEHNYVVDGIVAPIYDDTALIVSRETLREGMVYTVTALVSRADVQSLRASGGTYPGWVQARYLQLPPTLPQRVRDLAQQIVREANASNAYDQASAIQQYLRTLPYSEEIPAPPADRDLVDYFLFDMRQGYCDYYASAMVVMLRSLGVPARMVQGYAGGDFDNQRAAYAVYENIAHSWPEVYFPGFGWERFEPTAASYTAVPQRALVAALGDDPSEGGLNGANVPDPGRLEELDPGLDTGPTLGAGGGEHNRPSPAIASDWQRPLATFAALLACLGMVAAAGYARWRYELRGLSPAGAAFAGTAFLARWAGLAQEPHDTAHEYGTRLIAALPEHGNTLRHIINNYSAERYHKQHRLGAAPARDELRALHATLLRRIAGRFVGKAKGA